MRTSTVKRFCFLAFVIASPPFCALRAAPWTYTGTGAWNPPSGYVGNTYAPSTQAIPMDATVTENPPQIKITIYSGSNPANGNYSPNLSGTYNVYRKLANALTWSGVVGTVTVGTTNATWTDANVMVGQIYEYGVASTATQGTDKGYGFLVAGIKADQTAPRGRIAVVVASDVISQLPTEYAQYKADLVADGWFVHEIVVARAKDYLSNGTGPNDQYGVPGAPFFSDHVAIHSQLVALYQQYPGELKNVVLLGKVPVPRSGLGGIAPDGHENQAAMGADAYYADMDGIWTDQKSTAPFTQAAGTAVTGYVNNADGSVTLPASALAENQYYLDQVKTYRLQGGGPYTVSGYPYSFTVLNGQMTAMVTAVAGDNISVGAGTVNVDGDNKWDPEYMDLVRPNSDVELGFGRIDLSNVVPAEYESLRMYFNKLHRYKTASPDFRPARKAIQRAGFGTVSHACLAAMPGVFGMANIDWITYGDLPGVPDANSDPDSQYTKDISSALFYFKGNAQPTYSEGGRAVFWTGMQSHWGYWFSNTVSSGQNAMQRRLAEDNFTLSYTWSIGIYAYATSYLYHRMGMGFDAGDMMRISISSRGGSGALPGFVPTYARADAPLFMDHMGDPALRLFMFAPASRLSVVPQGGQPSLTWTASTEPAVLGYHVYRASTAAGPFTRLTTTPVAGTSYADASVSSGAWTYMVRAVRLETTGGGTFYNASLGIVQGIDLSNAPAPLQIATASLTDAQWNTAYQAALGAQGGTPVYTWSIDSGLLPPGLTLAPDGTISGVPTMAGIYNFVAKATDAVGQVTTRALSLTAQSNNVLIVRAEAGNYVGSLKPTVNGSLNDTATLISGSSYNNSTYLRFNLAGLNLNNRFVRARLILTVDRNSQANSSSLVQAALTADNTDTTTISGETHSGDEWTESGLSYANRPLDQPAVPPVNASGPPVPLQTLEIDVTPLVQATLAADPARKLSVRLFTTRGAAFGSEVKVETRYATGNAHPRLVLETTDAPAIIVNSPAGNSASIRTGSSLQINATATAIPARAGSLSLQWSKISGPGTVTFSDGAQSSTGATFSAPGLYVIRLTANDTVLQSYQDITVNVTAPQGGTAPVTGPTDSLLVRLPLDESSGLTAGDVSGQSPPNNGTLATLGTASLPTWSPTGGRSGGAISFSGTGQRVEITDSTATPLDGMQQLSVSLWVKTNTSDAKGRAVLVKRTTTVNTTISYQIYLDSTRHVVVNVANKTGITSGQVLTVGQWYHIVMVFDGSQATNNLQLFINGAPEAFTTVASQATLPRIIDAKVRIGDFADTALGGTFLSLDGTVDEVRLYNRALTWPEISSLAAVAPTNVGPAITLTNTVVSANVNQPFSLGATVTDDGVPSPLTLAWSQVSGPGSVSFNTPSAASTTATATAGGSYRLRLTANDGSILTGADVIANITAPLSAYQQWAQAHGLPTDGSGNGALTASPAGDGITNAMKYALGLDASTPGYNGRYTAGKVSDSGQQYLAVTYTRPEPAPAGVIYTIETSDDLNAWSSTQTVEVSNTVAGALRTITVRDATPVGAAAARRFIRLKVSVQ